MTDLQLALIGFGVLVVVGVLAYNRIQERAARRRTEQAFPSDRVDVLMAQPGSAPRREPLPDAAARRAEGGTASAPEELPDARLDYIIDLLPRSALSSASLLGAWAGIAARFGRRALLAVADAPDAWRRPSAAAPGNLRQVRAALQLVTRQGVTGEAEVVEFRTAVETLAAAIAASVSAPEMRQALESARTLDRACAEADIQVVLHVVAAPGASLDRDAIMAAAAALDIIFEDETRARVRDAEGRERYALVIETTSSGPALSVVLEVPRSPALGRTYREMLRAARSLAEALGASLQDDAQRTLDEAALESIGVELMRVEQSMEGLGVAPGGPLALRLFS